MKIDYDLKKNQKNIEERNLSSELARQFEWETAVITQDLRKDYPEERFVASGYLSGSDRLYILVFTPIPNGFRVISFRKANNRETKRYEDNK